MSRAYEGRLPTSREPSVQQAEDLMPGDVLRIVASQSVPVRATQGSIEFTSVADPTICHVTQFSSTVVSVEGKSPGGLTDLVLWYSNGSAGPLRDSCRPSQCTTKRRGIAPDRAARREPVPVRHRIPPDAE